MSAAACIRVTYGGRQVLITKYPCCSKACRLELTAARQYRKCQTCFREWTIDRWHRLTGADDLAWRERT